VFLFQEEPYMKTILTPFHQCNRVFRTKTFLSSYSIQISIGCGWVMNCPHYIDFTRECIRQYPAIIRNKDYSKCESEEYHKCIIFNILKSDFRCKHLNSCLNMFPIDIPEFYKLLNQDDTIYSYVTEPTYQYCLSKDHYVQCERYKMKEKGENPPPGLTPDGRFVNIEDSIRKRQIILKEIK